MASTRISASLFLGSLQSGSSPIAPFQAIPIERKDRDQHPRKTHKGSDPCDPAPVCYRGGRSVGPSGGNPRKQDQAHWRPGSTTSRLDRNFLFDVLGGFGWRGRRRDHDPHFRMALSHVPAEVAEARRSGPSEALSTHPSAEVHVAHEQLLLVHVIHLGVLPQLALSLVPDRRPSSPTDGPVVSRLVHPRHVHRALRARPVAFE